MRPKATNIHGEVYIYIYTGVGSGGQGGMCSPLTFLIEGGRNGMFMHTHTHPTFNPTFLFST